MSTPTVSWVPGLTAEDYIFLSYNLRVDMGQGERVLCSVIVDELASLLRG